MKFSIIVPVYNVEKYLRKCLESLISQTYNNFEIIIINDGSPDDSQLIIDEYLVKFPNLIKSYKKENGGLSDARNYGINKASGEFIIFVDSDDYIDCELLSNLNKVIENSEKIDIIAYNAKTVYLEDNEKSEIIKKPEFCNSDGDNAIKILIDGKQYFEPAWLYAFNKEYWDKNNFQFAKGRYHEDFGLIPETIIKAKNVTSIDYVGYYYMQTSNSIMRNNNAEKYKKRAYDILYHFDNLYKISEEYIKDEEVKKMFNSYIANAVINQINNLNGENRKEYIKQINKRNVFDLLLEDNMLRKIKKIYIKFKYRGNK